MTRYVGTVSRGLRAPVITEGVDLVETVVETLLKASEGDGFEIRDRDILAVTESILARSQGNFASLDAVSDDFRQKFTGESVGVVFPIMSRNRFIPILKAIARSTKKVIIQVSYPADEQGNHLVTDEQIEASGVNPWGDVLSEDEFREYFGVLSHPFTGLDYVQLYNECVEAEGAECQIIFSNNPTTILDYTENVLVANVHERQKTKKRITDISEATVYDLSEFMNEENTENGYNPEFGLLGANLSSETELKLFPRDCNVFVEKVQQRVKEETGKTIEVMIYGDGAFKDPVGQIWELADPVVSPGFTSGLEGTPDEVKLKYLADNEFAGIEGAELDQKVAEYIKDHQANHSDPGASVGTTPRQITDLVGTLADLTSGSGDKGTPFVYIQGYFDSLADD